MSDVDDATNVAAILHDIAANSDETTGKILKAADKAAKKGKSFIIVKVSQEDYDCVNSPNYYSKTSMAERLLSLGFTLNPEEAILRFWSGTKYYIKIKW